MNKVAKNEPKPKQKTQNQKNTASTLTMKNGKVIYGIITFPESTRELSLQGNFGMTSLSKRRNTGTIIFERAQEKEVATIQMGENKLAKTNKILKAKCGLGGHFGIARPQK